MVAAITTTADSPSPVDADHTGDLATASDLSDIATPTTITPSSTRSSSRTRPRVVPHYKPEEIECWGHRGASANLPENTCVLGCWRPHLPLGAVADYGSD